MLSLFCVYAFWNSSGDIRALMVSRRMPSNQFSISAKSLRAHPEVGTIQFFSSIGRCLGGSCELFPFQGIRGGGSGFLPDQRPILQCIVGRSLFSSSTLSCQSFALPPSAGS